jgi:hypothetical protein
MTPEEKAKRLVKKYTDMSIFKFAAKQCALISIDEILEYHESLYNKGLKDVHIAISSPIKTYDDILNPLLKYWQEVRQEIEKL